MSCKQETYKRLGDYIREVDVRNSAMEVNLSQGICNMKYFQDPRQVSSTPHLDKIVRTGQFAYNRATTRNGNKISIAYREGDDCTVSSAYCVFYITDEKVLNPYYLWLWFKRPNFDRYAIFKSHGSAHEFFEFETLCNTYVPMPPIEEQQRIVDQYLAIQKRIENNKKTIAKLEETAQAIYRKMFVDDIDPENLPEGWRRETISSIIKSTLGGDWGKEHPEGNYVELVSCIRGADINSMKVCDMSNAPIRYILKKNLEARQLLANDIVIEMSGGTPTQSTGRCSISLPSIISSCQNPLICSNFCKVIRAKKDCELLLFVALEYYYSLGTFFKYENSSNGIQNLDLESFCMEEYIIVPDDNTLSTFNAQIKTLFEYKINIGRETTILRDTLTQMLTNL